MEGGQESLGDGDATTTAPPPPAVPIHGELYPYRLGREIGRGGFGVVFEALDVVTGERVAVKRVLVRGSASRAAALEREVSLLSSLHHPHVVSYRGAVRTRSALFIITEWMEGGSLSAVLSHYGPLPEALAASFVAQVLRGLVFLHAQGVIHGDIKAANVLVAKDGTAKLADFGVATTVVRTEEGEAPPPSAAASSSSSSSSPTSPPAAAAFAGGSPYWMAPEVVELVAPTSSSDVWSVGCVAIELVTGRPPWYDLPPLLALYRVTTDASGPPVPDSASPALADFLAACLRRQPSLRRTAQELLRHPWILHALREGAGAGGGGGRGRTSPAAESPPPAPAPAPAPLSDLAAFVDNAETDDIGAVRLTAAGAATRPLLHIRASAPASAPAALPVPAGTLPSPAVDLAAWKDDEEQDSIAASASTAAAVAVGGILRLPSAAIPHPPPPPTRPRTTTSLTVPQPVAVLGPAPAAVVPLSAWVDSETADEISVSSVPALAEGVPLHLQPRTFSSSAVAGGAGDHSSSTRSLPLPRPRRSFVGTAHAIMLPGSGGSAVSLPLLARGGGDAGSGDGDGDRPELVAAAAAGLSGKELRRRLSATLEGKPLPPPLSTARPALRRRRHSTFASSWGGDGEEGEMNGDGEGDEEDAAPWFEGVDEQQVTLPAPYPSTASSVLFPGSASGSSSHLSATSASPGLPRSASAATRYPAAAPPTSAASSGSGHSASTAGSWFTATRPGAASRGAVGAGGAVSCPDADAEAEAEGGEADAGWGGEDGIGGGFAFDSADFRPNPHVEAERQREKVLSALLGEIARGAGEGAETGAVARRPAPPQPPPASADAADEGLEGEAPVPPPDAAAKPVAVTAQSVRLLRAHASLRSFAVARHLPSLIDVLLGRRRGRRTEEEQHDQTGGEFETASAVRLAALQVMNAVAAPDVGGGAAGGGRGGAEGGEGDALVLPSAESAPLMESVLLLGGLAGAAACAEPSEAPVVRAEAARFVALVVGLRVDAPSPSPSPSPSNARAFIMCGGFPVLAALLRPSVASSEGGSFALVSASDADAGASCVQVACSAALALLRRRGDHAAHVTANELRRMMGDAGLLSSLAVALRWWLLRACAEASPSSSLPPALSEGGGIGVPIVARFPSVAQSDHESASASPAGSVLTPSSLPSPAPIARPFGFRVPHPPPATRLLLSPTALVAIAALGSLCELAAALAQGDVLTRTRLAGEPALLSTLLRLLRPAPFSLLASDAYARPLVAGLRALRWLTQEPGIMDLLQTSGGALQILVPFLARELRGGEEGEAALSAPGGEGSSSGSALSVAGGTEAVSTALFIVFALCRLNRARQEEAVRFGLVAALRGALLPPSTPPTDGSRAATPPPPPHHALRHLETVAAPLLCDIVHASPTVRDALRSEGAAEVYVELLRPRHSAWSLPALAALAILAASTADAGEGADARRLTARLASTLTSPAALPILTDLLVSRASTSEAGLAPFALLLSALPSLALALLAQPQAHILRHLASLLLRGESRPLVLRGLLAVLGGFVRPTLAPSGEGAGAARAIVRAADLPAVLRGVLQRHGSKVAVATAARGLLVEMEQAGLGQ
jgi:hypothetical protein